MDKAASQHVAAWVESARLGDAAAFEKLVARFQDAVAGVILARIGPGPDVEDLAQDAFLAAFRQLGTFQDPPNFGRWVCGIARNLARRHVRDRRRMQQLRGDVPAPLDARAAPLAGSVMSAAQALPARLREPVMLFYINGYSTDQIAGFVQIPPGTVRRRLHEARARLREHLEKDMSDQIKRHAPRKGFAKKTAKKFVVEQRPGFLTTMTSDDPAFSRAKARRHWKEMKMLINQGRYKLVGVRRAKSGMRVYLYRFKLSDGTVMCLGTNRLRNPGFRLRPPRRAGRRRVIPKKPDRRGPR